MLATAGPRHDTSHPRLKRGVPGGVRDRLVVSLRGCCSLRCMSARIAAVGPSVDANRAENLAERRDRRPAR